MLSDAWRFSPHQLASHARSKETTAHSFCQPAASTAPHLRWSGSVAENTRTRCALSVFPSRRANFDFTSGTRSDRSQMIVGWVAAELFDSSEWPRELWEHSSGSQSSPSAVLEDPLQRAGWGPVAVQRLGHPSPSVSPLRPHLKLSGQPPRGKMPVALLGLQLRITHQFINAACQQRLCWVDT